MAKGLLRTLWGRDSRTGRGVAPLCAILLGYLSFPLILPTNTGSYTRTSKNIYLSLPVLEEIYLTDFVHLHCHSQYSLRDGVASVEELVCAAKCAGMRAIALTDHGNMFGLIPFYKECTNEKMGRINPIIGVEAYVAIFNRFVKTTKIECAHRPL